MRMIRMMASGAVVLGLGLAPALAAVPMSAGAAGAGQGQGMDRSEPASSVYTDALNAFMAHGWHAVSGMRQKGGMVVASGVNAQDQVHRIIWHPGSDRVSVAG